MGHVTRERTGIDVLGIERRFIFGKRWRSTCSVPSPIHCRTASVHLAVVVALGFAGLWGQWYDFKASAVMLAAAHALHTSDGLALANTLWSDNDDAINADGSNGAFNSLQFMAGLRVRLGVGVTDCGW
jgi:hypothetical protein